MILGLAIFIPQYLLIQEKKTDRQLEIVKQNSIDQDKKEKEDQAQQEVLQNKILLESCLAKAGENYQDNFESYCISEKRGANCQSILKVNAAIVDQIERDEKNDCFKKYPQN